MIDLSRITSLSGLAEATASVVRVASSAGSEIFLTGAFARDLWIEYVFRLEAGRRTQDTDFAMQCADWQTFERVAAALNDLGVSRHRRIQHRFRHPNGTEIDLIPYGGVESPERRLPWPPGDTVMNLLGFSEVANATTLMRLPGGIDVPVVDLDALALLKLLAWEDRRTQSVHKDAADVLLIGGTYFITRRRPISDEEKANVLERNDWEEGLAGAELLGRDIAALAPPELRRTLRQILAREADEKGLLGFARALGMRPVASAIAFLQALRTGFDAY